MPAEIMKFVNYTVEKVILCFYFRLLFYVMCHNKGEIGMNMNMDMGDVIQVGDKSDLIFKINQVEDPMLNLTLSVGYMTGSARKSGDLEYSRPGLTISGALTYALDELSRNNFFSPINVNVNFKIQLAETFGDEESSIREVADLWRNKNVSVIIGPQETCKFEARLAKSLNIPMISYFCSDEQTSDKNKFSTFSRTRPPDAAISRAIVSLVLKYGWLNSLIVIYSDSDDQRFKSVAKSLGIFLDQYESTFTKISYKGPYHDGYGENPFDSIVSSTKERARIYILISEYFEHLGLVLALKRQNLLNGDYLVIGVSMDDFKEEEWNQKRYFRGILRDEIEKFVPESFQSYLGIVSSPPKDFTEFSRKVNNFMEKPPFNFINPLSKFGGFKKIRIEAAYLFDAVMLYAKALKDIIYDEIGDLNLDFATQFDHLEFEKRLLDKISDGKEISKRLRNINYQSATGHLQKMDQNGEAEGNFTLISLKMKDENLGLYPVGFFMLTNGLPDLKLTESIDWLSGSPPFSEPECGFNREKCPDDQGYLLGLSIGAVALLILASGLFLIILLFRQRRDIDIAMWRIDKKDIQWESGHMPLNNVFKFNTGSQASLTKFSSVFAPLVNFRERLFAAKCIEDIDLDASMKRQLKTLKEIRHENLNSFIGACIYDEGFLLINEYCSRGSIRDILENGDIKLDDMFISSLIGDLIRGLLYLHDSSQIRYHGNLKPSNCLIDSRFCLKLSDFGPIYTGLIKRGLDIQLNSTNTGTGGPGGSSSFKHRSSGRTNSNNIANNQNSPNNQGIISSAAKGPSPSIGSTSFGLRNSVPNISPYLPPEYPTLCKGQFKNNFVEPFFRKGDVYSFAIIIFELLKRETLSKFLLTKDEGKIRQEILANNFWSRALNDLNSPQNTSTETATTGTTSSSNVNSYQNAKELPLAGEENNRIPSQALDCLKDCLQFDPESRPDIKSVRVRLRPLHKGMRSNIFDIMIGLMESYANNLEHLVDDRTKQLSEEKRKTETLLYELLPASVAEELKEGLRVPAKSFNCVSIYFSDIVGFTSMSAKSSALEVVEFLNDLYTLFDSVIGNFDVYKVETIGDAYMVASGLPNPPRESNHHALEMASMALKLKEEVLNFKIRHRPNEEVKLRIGVHSGPVCAGVVGKKRPRYCLFGDTVNTASRMESSGKPLRIHCSEAFAKLIEKDFLLEKRGVVDVKGKGDMITFWLIRALSKSPENFEPAGS